MKKIIIGILMSLIVVLMTGTVYGALSCTFDQTATTVGTSSTYLKGTTKNLSITIAGHDGSAGNNISVAIISAGATGCTISGALIYNLSGTNNTYLNTTVDTTTMKDDTSCTFTMTLKNDTQGTVATCTRAFYSDNTKPAFSDVSPSDNSKDSDGSIDFSITCSNSSSVDLYISNTKYTATESSDTCSLTKKLSDGKYSYYYIASDGLNSTQSSTYTVHIETSGTSGIGGSTLEKIQAKEKKEEVKKKIEGMTRVIGKGIPVDVRERIVARTKEEFTRKELTKTAIGVGGGAAVGFTLGLMGGPLALITVPIGMGIGAFIGALA